MTHKLIIIRHGQSTWNLENRFTGWRDVDLTEKGREEARLAGVLLKGVKLDMAYTSVLKRAMQTLDIVLQESGNTGIPIIQSAALNERGYGALEGLNKDEVAAEYGSEQVHLWRRSYDVRPPEGESLQDTAERVIPYFKEQIVKQIKLDKKVIIVAHGNSLRALIMYLEKLSPKEILDREIPTGLPLQYELSDDLSVEKVYYLAEPYK